MARPREDHVPETTINCPTHGVVKGRVHKIGIRPNGTQRYRVRCMRCHNARNGGRA